MRFAVIGAGGIGCYYAARLIDAGEDVCLIARGDHLKALQNNGLKVMHPQLTFHQSVKALSMEDWFKQTPPDGVDVLIVCLKGMHTQAFAEQLKHWFDRLTGSESPLILSLQNGVENEKIIAGMVPDAVIVGGIARRIGAHIVAPGVIQARGPAQVILGIWPDHQQVQDKLLIKVNALADHFNRAAIPTQVSSDINRELWRKLIVNNGVNPLCALLEMETGQATHHPGLQRLIRGAMAEAATAASAMGVTLTNADIEEMFNLIYTFGSIKPSMLVDREKGRQLELEEICGVIIRGCQALGQDAPYNRCIATLLSVALEQSKS